MIDVPGVKAERIENIESLQLIKSPLQLNDLVIRKEDLIDEAVYLLVYTDEIELNEFEDLGAAKEKEELEAIRNERMLPHDRLPLCKTFMKAFLGQGTNNKHLFCSFSQCMRAFNESGNLKTHMRTHTGDRPYICEIPDCGKTFITKGHLQTHQLIHTGEKPFKCNICHKEYARSGRLKIHQRTHTGERPYSCE